MRTFSKDVVLTACKGRYNELALHFFPEMSRALASPGRHVPDPWKDHGKDGFRVMRDFNVTGYMVCNNNFGLSGKPFNLFNLMQYTHRVSSFNEALEMVGSYLGCERTGMYMKGSTDRKPLTAAQKAEIAEARRKAAKAEQEAAAARQRQLHRGKALIDNQLQSCVSLFSGQADEAWQYLESRGLGALKSAPESLLSDLSYCPRCPYYENGKLAGYYGALISQIKTSDGKLWSLHRTFLNGGRKAPVSCPKKIMSPAFDAEGRARFIKLGDVPDHGIIGIAEGIETALSANIGMRIPVWSAISASFMVEFEPPKDVKAVLIFADKDANRAGQQAASELHNRLKAKGVKSFIVTPKSEIPAGSKGIDWNDELRTKGVFAFPEPFSTLYFIMDHQN